MTSHELMMKVEQNESIILKQRARERDVDFIKWRHASPGGVMAQRQLRHSKGQREGEGGRERGNIMISKHCLCHVWIHGSACKLNSVPLPLLKKYGPMDWMCLF